MVLASSTTTAAALTVRLDPELVAPSLQPSKPCLSCCRTLDRPEKRPGATLFAGNCTSSVLCAWRHIFKTGTWCTRRVVLVLVQSARACGWRGIRKLGAAGGAEGCMRHSSRPTQPLQAGARSKRPLRLALSFPTFFSTQY